MPADFLVLRETTWLLLRERELAVDEHVELALLARGRLGDVLRLRVHLGHETRGPSVIAVSDGAVVDLDLHGRTSVSCAAGVATTTGGGAHER